VIAASVVWVRGFLSGHLPGPIFAAFLEGTSGLIALLSFATPTIAILVVGAVVTFRVPGNAIGPTLLGVGVWTGCALFVVMALFSTQRPDLMALANWLGAWAFVPMIFVPVTVVLLLFPNGQPLTVRFRTLVWLGWVVTVSWSLAEATRPLLGAGTPVVNPLANPTLSRIADAVTLLGVPVLIGAVISLVRRFRTSGSTVRQQVKWVAFGGGIEVGIFAVVWYLSAASPEVFGVTVVAVAGLTALVTPLAIGAAILRYRLYDIEHLVSRTVSYAGLAVLLAGLYALAVIGIQYMLPARGDFAVAAATLATVAAFSPARRVIQTRVDRHFNRARYDASRVIDSFVSTLGSANEEDRLISHLIDTLERTIAPSSVGVWVRPTQQPRP
jgi:hypothetical protein